MGRFASEYYAGVEAVHLRSARLCDSVAERMPPPPMGDAVVGGGMPAAGRAVVAMSLTGAMSARCGLN